MKKMRLINCTRKDIHLMKQDDNGKEIITIKKSGTVPVFKEITMDVVVVNGVKIKRKIDMDMQNLPQQEEGVVYLVAKVVAEKIKEFGLEHRQDLMVPCDQKKDDEGRYYYESLLSVF